MRPDGQEARSVRLDTRGRALAAVALAMAFSSGALTACGSDDNRGASTAAVSGAAGAAGCGGKNGLTAEGSTAQQNAIALFNQAWGQSCPGKSVSYNPTGS